MISKLNRSFLSFLLKKIKKNLVEDTLLDNHARFSACFASLREFLLNGKLAQHISFIFRTAVILFTVSSFAVCLSGCNHSLKSDKKGTVWIELPSRNGSRSSKGRMTWDEYVNEL